MRVTDSDNGHQVELSTGDELQVILEANPSTGYKWQLREAHIGVLRPSARKFSPYDRAVGAGGKDILTFRAVSPGCTKLKLSFERPFEQGKPPAKEFSLGVTVTDPP